MTRWSVHGQRGSDVACTFRMAKPLQRTLPAWAGALALAFASVLPCLAGMADYGRTIQPLLKQYCLGCHSTEKHKGDLDLERFTSLDEILKHPKPWQEVLEKLSLNEMPPKEKPQPTPAERGRLIAWVNSALDNVAKAHAGDPGPVVLRRLSNAEYTYTVRDLAGVESLDPAREFPADSASGEGFMNVGNSLVMSPSLLAKYLDAAKDIANHAVLLPDGIAFSPSTSQRDWTEEKLAAIRAFYGRFSENGGGTSVNLQGIKFDTKDGGVLPLRNYLAATLSVRDKLGSGRQPRPFRGVRPSSGAATSLGVAGGRRSGPSPLSDIAAPEDGRTPLNTHKETIAEVAREQGLNAKYLSALWTALNDPKPSLVLDQIRSQWRAAKPDDVGALVQTINQWQQALWRFTTVGHIGKRDGPKAWQVPVTPLAGARELRLKVPAPTAGRGSDVRKGAGTASSPQAETSLQKAGTTPSPPLSQQLWDSRGAGEAVTLYLAVSDAGDGNEQDFAVWENPRLVAPGRPDIPLRDLRVLVSAFNSQREKAFSSAAECLAAATEVTGSLDQNGVAQLAQKHEVEPAVLTAWLNCLGIGMGEARIDSYITQKLEKLEGYDFVKGWTGADALSVIANSSDQHVRVPGNMKPHGVAVHPSPKLAVIVGWRSPVAATLRVDGVVQHAHPECGNGVTWAVELRRGNSRQRLAAGTAQDAKEVKFGPFENLAVQPGDVMSVVIGPRDGNHSCDLTAVDLNLSDGTRTWNLAKEISPNILAGNPHADSQGNTAVWHFYSESDQGGGAETVLPARSLLAKWQAAASPDEKQRFARRVQKLLVGGAAGLTNDAPDAKLYRQLTSLNGPLLSSLLRSSGRESAQASGVRPSSGAATSEQADAPERSDGQSRRKLAAPEDGRTPSGPTGWGLDPALFGKHPSGGSVGATSLCVRAPSVIEVRLPADLAEGCEFVATGTLERETGAEGSVQMQILTTKPASTAGLVVGAAKEQGAKGTWSDGERPVVSDSPIIVRDGSVARKRIETALDEFRQLFPAAVCYTKIVPVDEVVTLTLFYREDDQLRRLMLDDAQAAELDRLWAGLHYVSHDALKLVDAFEQLWQYATQDADPSAFTPLREPIKQRAEEFKRFLLDTQPAHLDAVLKFAEGAYRRPLTVAEQDELRGLYRKLRAQEIPHAQAIRLTLARVLVSPAFLYRSEKPGPGKNPAPVNDWELATRLSYFLWSSAPDAELRGLAAKGQLHKPAFLAAQARRMARDPRVRRLATEFACAWLHIHDFESFDEKSERHFPTFAALRGPMYEEAIRFFTDAFQNDASVLTLFDANYTFLNQALAEHYGIPGVTGSDWRRVENVKQYGRGGVLGMGATLAKQSGASRTSPILRGDWVAEVLLGDKIPRPPKDVPRLPEEEATEKLTVRQLTMKHSTDPLCAGCHKRFDGYGYALEGYDAIGRARTRDLGDRPIDARAKVLDGTTLDGADGLRHYLLTTKRDFLVRQFCRKLVGYALGRAVMLSDKPLLAEMETQLRKHDYRFTVALETIVRSKQFREIRGKEVANEE